MLECVAFDDGGGDGGCQARKSCARCVVLSKDLGGGFSNFCQTQIGQLLLGSLFVTLGQVRDLPDVVSATSSTYRNHVKSDTIN
jgi:hypothetical protein